MTRTAILIALGLLAGCSAREYEDAIADPTFLMVRDACDAGDLDACQVVLSIRADRQARQSAALLEMSNQFYRTGRGPNTLTCTNFGWQTTCR